MMECFIAPDMTALYAEATRRLDRAVAAGRGGRVNIALSGGSTPLGWFDRLARSWRPPGETEIDFYWVDERRVPPDDPESNFGNAARRWLGRLSADDPRVRLHPLDDAHRGEYRDGLRFDQVWLGVGPDGHTASWFPGGDACCGEGVVAEVPAPAHVAPALPRLTLTLKPVLAAAEILVLFTGEAKRVRVFTALGVRPPAPEHPLSYLAPAADKLTLLYCE